MKKEQDARAQDPFVRQAIRRAIIVMIASGVVAPILGRSVFDSAWGSGAVALSATSSVQLHSFKTHGRLVVRVDEAVEAQWKDIPGGFELFLNGISLADLGAPVGGERNWAESRGFYNDPRITSLAFDETPKGVRISGKWKFLKGDLAPADSSMEHFDYRQKSPAQYVVDFWPKKGITVGEAKRQKRDKDQKSEIARQAELARKRAEQKAEIVRVRAEMDDLGRFCTAPLSEANDVFLPFQPYREKVDFSRWFNISTPDSDFTYSEPQGDHKDAQYSRIALDLYRKGDFALVLKTLDFLDAEFPMSEHRHEMKFLRANALIKLGMVDQSHDVLADLKATASTSVAGLQAGLYTAVTALQSKEYLASLEGFLWLINRFPDYRLSWVFHLGVAEAAFALGQTERAAKEYQWISENAKDLQDRAMAAFRIGDVYLTRAQDEQAIAAYFNAMNRFKEEAKSSAGIHINRAEALYWLGQMEHSKKEFEAFLKNFPAHPAGWRATFRLGEIAARTTNAKTLKASLVASRKRFAETINRFPFSPGAVLARVRLAPCGDHGGFDQASANKFFREDAERFTGDEQVMMDSYREFRGIAQVRTLTTLGATDQAIDVAIAELQANPRFAAREILGQSLRSLFRKSLMAKLNAGDTFGALKFYEAKVDRVPPAPRDTDLLETRGEYLLKLSRAASDLGLGSLAQRIAGDYDRGVKRGGARSPAEEAEFEKQLQRANARFTEAKALFVSAGAAEESKITELLADVGAESPHSHDREIILGRLAEEAGKHASALAHALRAQLLASADARGTDRMTRLQAWIAELQSKAGDPRAAIAIYHDLRSSQRAPASSGKQEIGENLGLPAAPVVAEAVLIEGELLARIGQWAEAAKTYLAAVEQGLGGNRALYEYSRTLRRTGAKADVAKADEAMRKLASSDQDDFWRKLARTATGDPGNGKNAKEGGK